VERHEASGDLIVLERRRSKLHLLELAVEHVDPAIMEVGGVEKIARADAVNGDALEHSVGQVHGKLGLGGRRRLWHIWNPSGDRAIFRNEDKDGRGAFAALGMNDEIARTVENLSGKRTETADLG